jgi:hypothetical protein
MVPGDRRQKPEGRSLAAGPAKLRIGGYVGVHGIYRSTNSGGGVGTNFAIIPYADIVQGNVSESGLSAQESRLSIRGSIPQAFGVAPLRARRISMTIGSSDTATMPRATSEKLFLITGTLPKA